MKLFSIKSRTLALIAVLVPLLVLFIYVALRSGPLAPISVTVTTVESRTITPGLFGIGTVEARFTYKIGPTFAGRVKRLEVHVGDRVQAGQILGEMDPVDLDQRIHSQDAVLTRAQSLLNEAEIRRTFAQTQARRYEQLMTERSTSKEIAATKKYELQAADAALVTAGAELARIHADRQVLIAQRDNLRLTAPVDSLVVARDADPGTTLVAGQAAVELIDPTSLWVNVRFDQIDAHGLAADLPAQIVLRSQTEKLSGRVLRVEPLADVVTEEVLAKVVFDYSPEALPPVGELAEVTVALPALAAGRVIPNAAIQRMNGKLGVWQVLDGDLRFTPVSLSAADLEGRVLVREGLEVGDRVVVYSARALRSGSNIKIVDHLPGVAP